MNQFNDKFTTALVLFAALATSISTVHAQGSLTPPGAPAPTMKSLDQIEARTAITNTSSLAIISQPGSYYLTHNLTVSSGDAIDITTNGVTLNLNGFTISSTAASHTGTAILLASTTGNSDIAISNGHIRGGVTNNAAGAFNGPGFDGGIYYVSTNTYNAGVSHVSVSGCFSNGIVLPETSTLVESCMVQSIGQHGIFAATVSQCQAVVCGGQVCITAVTANNCYASGVGAAQGLSCFIANNCYGSSGSGIGVLVDVANNCFGFSSSGAGLNAAGTATGCYGQSVVSMGITAKIANACFVGGGTTNITYKFNMP